jgi:hypothetical protein
LIEILQNIYYIVWQIVVDGDGVEIMDIGGMYQISLHAHLVYENQYTYLLTVAYGPDVNGRSVLRGFIQNIPD